MSTTIYHKHHITPRHAGGSNSTSNIKVVSVQQHAEEHRLLFEQHGRFEDKLAWKMLEGQELIGDLLRIKSKLGWEKANKNGPITKDRVWCHNPENPIEQKMIYPDQELPTGWLLGRGVMMEKTFAAPHTEEHKAKIRASVKKAWEEGKMNHRNLKTRTQAVLDGVEKLVD